MSNQTWTEQTNYKFSALHYNPKCRVENKLSIMISSSKTMKKTD